MKFSVCIPCYEMNGVGDKYLDHNLKVLSSQTFQDFEVVISDHSTSNIIQLVSEKWIELGLNIKYLKNNENIGSSSGNINKCIENSKGEIIKIIFQDDYLYSENSLLELSEYYSLNPNFEWVVTSCCHTHDGENYFWFFNPVYTDQVLEGKNTISSPSVLSFRNHMDNLYFDTQLIWLMDCEYYYRLYLKYGLPGYLYKTNVVNRIWEGQVSKRVTNKIKRDEQIIIKNKHGK